MNRFKCVLLLLITITVQAVLSQDTTCHSRDFGNEGTVCVCNKDYCDTLQPFQKLATPYYQIFTSSKAGLRFNRTQGTFQQDDPGWFSWKLTVNKQKKYQKIIGFGGAFTDSFGINLKSLSNDLQTKLITSYFSLSDGIGYNLARVPIASTDFSNRGYTYCDTEDLTLSKFNLTDDDYQYKIPYIQEAITLTSDPLLLFAAAWAAPKWMKTNGAYAYGGIKEDMYDLWANYFIKFLEAYQNENITFWGISTGNEPSLALINFVRIPSNRWLPHEMIKWVAGSLGPAIRNSKDFNNTKIMILDDQRLFIPWFINLVFTNESVKNYVDIIAVHWYCDKIIPAVTLDLLHDAYPDIPIMGTEASVDGNVRGMNEPPVLLGSWARGELYSSSIIEDLNHYVASWTDWNMALDPSGGPAYIGNYIDSPIIINTTAGEFYKQPMYYALGHFSKFIPRDSVRIELQGFSLVESIGFLRPDGGTVVVLVNKRDFAQELNVVDITRGKITYTLEPRSISTIIYF